MMVFLQNELQNSGGNPIHGDPGWSNTHILTKNVPNISIIQIIDHLKYKVATNMHSGQSMKAILQNEWQKRGGNPIYGDPSGSNAHILTKNKPKYWYYQNNNFLF